MPLHQSFGCPSVHQVAVSGDVGQGKAGATQICKAEDSSLQLGLVHTASIALGGAKKPLKRSSLGGSLRHLRSGVRSGQHLA